MNQNNNTDNRNIPNQKPTLDASEAIRIELRIEELVKSGMSESDARLLVETRFATVRQEKAKMEIRTQKEKKEWRYFQYAAFAALVAAVPVSFIHSPVGYFIAILVGAFAGYYAIPHKPLAGIIGTIIGVIVSLIISHIYFYNKSSYRAFELFAPVIPAAIVAYLLIKIIGAVFYRDKIKE